VPVDIFYLRLVASIIKLGEGCGVDDDCRICLVRQGMAYSYRSI
jgi:hypothetical protein